MWIIIWILQSFLNATWMILSKKIFENKILWNNFLTLLNRTYHSIIIWTLFWVWILSYNINEFEFSLYNIILFIIAAWWIYITYPLRRVAYANEKISVLQPFAMLYQVFPIIIGFIFIASERVNIITFLSALLASFIVIISNIDFKKIKINKYSLMILISSIIKSFQLFACVYFLTIMNPATFYFTESLVIIIIAITILLIKKEFNEYKLITKPFIKITSLSNTIVVWSILLSLTMFKSLWIVSTSLLSLLYIFFLYILSYLFLKEIPSKKDLIVTWFVVICIITWLYFKT